MKRPMTPAEMGRKGGLRCSSLQRQTRLANIGKFNRERTLSRLQLELNLKASKRSKTK